jgi:6-phosphogluconolactonase (cycloisomerase 2 family)
MNQSRQIPNEAEFDKLLAEPAERVRQKLGEERTTPKSESTKTAERFSDAPRRAVEFSADVVRGSLIHEGARRIHHFFATLFTSRRSSMLRDVSVLVLTVAAVGITASCIQNLSLTPGSATVSVGQTATFTAKFGENGGNGGQAPQTSWILTQAGSSKSCSPGCGTLSAPVSTVTPGCGGCVDSVVYTAPATVPTPSTVSITFGVSDHDGGTSANSTITVTAGTNNSLTVTPASQTVIAGSTTTQQFTANQNGSAATGITWALTQSGSSCLPAVCGSLSSTTANPVTYTPPTTFSASGTATLTATQTSSSQTPSAAITIQPATLQSIAVTPTGPTIQVGQTEGFTATGTYSNGLQQVLTSGVTWASSNANIASISSAGLAAGLMPGTTSITATQGTPPVASTGVTLTVVPAPQATVPRYLFEFNGDATISTYAVVPSTGQLRSITYLPTGANPEQAVTTALNPNLNVLYTVQPVSTGQQFVTYSVSAGGVLTQQASSSIVLANFGQILADPLGRFLWVVDTTANDILSYPLDPVTGATGTQTIAASVPNLQVLAADPTGTYLFSEDSGGNVNAFTVGSGGTLSALGTPPTAHPFSRGTMVVDPSGKYLYVMDASSINQIFGYIISSTGLASMSGSPFMVPNNGEVDTQMVIDPTSSFLYALDGSSPTQPIDAFLIGSGGALTSLTETLQAPSEPGLQQITLDPSGKYLFAAYGGAHEVWTYSITQTGTSRGTLSPVSRMRLRSASFIPSQLLSAGTAAVQFSPQALYVTNSTSNSVAEFTIAPATGALTLVSGSPQATSASHPTGITLLPNGNFAYTADFSGNIESFNITNNALSPLGQPFVTDAGTGWITSDLSGSFLYSVSQINSDVRQYSLTSGVISLTTTQISTGTGPVFITNDPTGQFLYTANVGATSGIGGGSINAFSIGLPGGALTAAGSAVTTVPQTDSVAVDPSGRFLYATNTSANALYEFVIGAGTGALTANTTSQFLPIGPSASSPGGTSVVVEPSGQYVYATNQVDNQIFAFHIDPVGGFLADVHTSMPNSEVADTDSTPVALAVDASGQYLYCVNSGGNDINIYKINLADGTLTPVGTAAVPTGGTAPAGIALTGTRQ